MHLAVAAAPHDGFQRRHRIAVAAQRFTYRNFAQLRKYCRRMGPGVSGQFGLDRPAVDQG